jgi:tight adherence protein C
MSAGPPAFFWLLLAGGAFALGIHGLRGVLAIREALRDADLRTLTDPSGWRVTRAFCGLCAALPVLLLALDLGYTAVLSALAVGTLGYAVAPRFLESLRHGVEREVLDDLTVHLDLMALAAEAGSSLPAALSLAAEHGPQGALRRAFAGVMEEVHGGVEPLDALRALDQRLGVRPFSTWVTALRSAERLGMPLAQVLRERATQSAANRFARAERLARAAPLKLWATLVLCIAPCTLIVLAFPMARFLARIAGK